MFIKIHIAIEKYFRIFLMSFNKDLYGKMAHFLRCRQALQTGTLVSTIFIQKETISCQ